MGYAGPYSLRARCASEVVATLIGVFLGNAVIANTQLSRTKALLHHENPPPPSAAPFSIRVIGVLSWLDVQGHGQPFGWIALGYGLSFGIAIEILGSVSAHVNPATCIALWITGVDLRVSSWHCGAPTGFSAA